MGGNALKEREEGKRIPFTIIEKATGKFVAAQALAVFLIMINELRSGGAGWRNITREQE